MTKSAWWLVVLQIGAFFGYISFGWIADRIGRRPAFTLFMIAARFGDENRPIDNPLSARMNAKPT